MYLIVSVQEQDNFSLAEPLRVCLRYSVLFEEVFQHPSYVFNWWQVDEDGDPLFAIVYHVFQEDLKEQGLAGPCSALYEQNLHLALNKPLDLFEHVELVGGVVRMNAELRNERRDVCLVRDVLSDGKQVLFEFWERTAFVIFRVATCNLNDGVVLWFDLIYITFLYFCI